MVGKKIENLEILRQHGFPVPDFITVSKDTDISKLNIPWQTCAVRSSASIEDGEHSSFAGQFDTFLNVPMEEVVSRIEQCFASMDNESVREYAKHHHFQVEQADMHVIVQEMIPSEFSGVCFTANPQGILNESVIVVGKGTGDNVVEDKVDTTSYYYNLTDRIYYYEGKEDVLSEEMVHRIVETASAMQPILGDLLDIEFAIAGENLYILQARTITTLSGENPLILDNSNIVESYPGLSLPLTCSLVRIVYGGVFKSVSRRVLKDEKVLSKYDSVYGNMVGHVNGRIYYKISNWYTIIKFMPMNQKLIPIWQDMMGVKIKTYDTEAVKLTKIQRLKTYFNVISEMWNVPKNMNKLNEDFQRIQASFYEKYHEHITSRELIGLYRELHDTLFACWDVTLLNDIYAFLFTGLVKKRLGESGNLVISGISNIESMKPVREMICLAYEKNSLDEHEYQKRFEEYIRVYGDRNLEELKLESKTFRSHPELLTEKIVQYNEDPDKLADMYQKLMQEAPPAKKLRGINKFLANRAAKGIANREISRLNRSRIFGMVRLIFTKMGEEFAGKGILEEAGDIFWITVEEAFSLAENEKYLENVKELIEERKAEYKLFAGLPAYQRLIFEGKEFDKKHRSVNAHTVFLDRNKLIGTPCSNGIAEGEALVVTDVTKVKDYKNKILVTKMTDPGWVFLLVGAKGVISEKGSLLSHTAIISRELKIPSVVGVEKLLDTIRTGDRIRMNGNTGEIEILKE